MAGEKKGPGVPAAKVTYNVYIVDKHPTKHPAWKQEDDYTKNGIIKQLTDYFEKIAAVAHYTGTPKARVNWVSSWPARIEDHEMICYLVPKTSSAFKNDTSKAHGQGMTGWRNGSAMLSEVWVETVAMFGLDSFIDMVSKIIFHELMHQKLDAHPNDADTDMHNRPDGLGVTPVSQVSTFTDADRDDMAAAIDKKYRQLRV